MAVSTLRQIALPFTSIAKWYTNCAKAHPLTTAILTSGIKTSAADLFAQKVIEKKEHIDLKRHALFCCFGFGYLGCFQYYLYNIKFVQWCTPISNVVGHVGTAPFKVFLDQCIHHPLLYFPVFYSMKAGVERKPLSWAAQKYHDEIWESLKALWSVWVPSQLVNFAFVPRHFRVPWVAMTSFVWTIILSLMQGQFDHAKEGTTSSLQQDDGRKSAHYAAMQIHAGIPAATTAVTEQIFPPAEAAMPSTPPAASPKSPTTALLPPSAAVAVEQDTAAAAKSAKPPPKVYSVLEARHGPLACSFGPYSMAMRLATAITR